MTYKDKRTPKEKLAEYWDEILSDMAEEILQNQITPAEVADLMVKSLDDWLDYFKQQANIYEAIKDALGRRVS